MTYVRFLLMCVALALVILGGFMPGTGYWSGLIAGVALMKCSAIVREM